MNKALLILLVAALFGCKGKDAKMKEVDSIPASGTENEVPQTLKSKAEDGWTVLFDGTSFNGWHLYNAGEIDEPWTLEDGAMVFSPPKDRPKGESYNIVTDKEFTNFVLSLEWKISEQGNSGIFWGVYEDEKFGEPYLTGPEIQILDDEKHPDGKNGASHQSGALYDMVAPSKKVVKPVGEWNLVELTINHKTYQGQVVMNGEKIVEFPVHGPKWDEMVSNSKFADWEGFGAYQTGKIGLQDHGDKVAYRNIKIKEL